MGKEEDLKIKCIKVLEVIRLAKRFDSLLSEHSRVDASIAEQTLTELYYAMRLAVNSIEWEN